VDEFFQQIRSALLCSSPHAKTQQVRRLTTQVSPNHPPPASVEKIVEAGRPTLPILVHPAEVVRRRLGSQAGRAALIHAIAHIEFNAINLALDAAYRFRGLPAQFYTDWLRVAADESRHFEMLSQRLQELDSFYGALPAHGGLWAMAVETDYDSMARMALVPRVLEARGLDVTPGMIERLSRAGDDATVEILRQILREEIDHVLIGNRWFIYLCTERGLDAATTFSQLLRRHGRIALRGPFNREARLAAGFSDAELRELDQLEKEFAEESALADQAL